MLAAQVLVAAGHPVLTAHVPQPGLQPGAILQREPARGARSAMSGPTPAPTAPPPHRALSAKPLPPSGQSLAMPPNQVVCVWGGGTHSVLSDCNPTDCSLPGSSVHGILQARILEWVATPSSKDLPHPEIEPGFPDSLPSESLGKPISASTHI